MLLSYPFFLLSSQKEAGLESSRQMVSQGEQASQKPYFDCALKAASNLPGPFRHPPQPKELPTSLKTMKGGAHLTLSDLERVMEWKLTRGKMRPLMGRVKGNKPDLVESVSRQAFAAVGSEGEVDEAKLRRGFDHLCKLDGIGPATASAILAAYR